MAQVTTDLKVVIRTAGDAQLDKLTRTLNGLGRQAKSAAAPFDQISKELKEVQRTSVNSIANLRGYRNAWRDITQQVEIGSAAFKEATAEAARLDKQLQKAEGRKGPGRGGRLRAAAQVAGTVAGAGVFGGPEGAAGALLGSIAGPGGAIVGGAIGAQVGQFRQALGASAEYAASIAKLRIALKGVTTSQTDYNNALDFVQQATTKFAIPQEIVTRQFTKLQASVQGAGGNLEDTKTAFNGIVASVRATGGSLQDIDSALTATAQVFSKGKVSAEELRQQIGERLPGAFTLFAKSLGKTPQELDKALEKGEVSLQDFQTFAEEIFKKYGKTAEIIASSPEAAGDRLAVALSNMNESVGRLLQPIGTAFQEVFTVILEQITAAADALDNFLGISAEARIEVLNAKIQDSNQQLLDLNREIGEAQRVRPEADLLGGAAAQGGGLGGLLAERQRIVNERNLASAELDRANALKRIKGEIEQSRPGGGLPGIVLDGTDPSGSQAKIRDTSDDVLRLTQDINAAKKAGQLIRAEELRLELDIQKITEQYNDKKITFNRASELSSNANAASQARTLRLQEQIAKQDQEKDKALNQIRLVTGEITQEEFNQEQITQKALELVKLFPEEFKRVKAALEEAASPLGQFKKGLKEVFESAMDVKTAIGDVAVQAVSGLGDVFADFVVTGKANFAEFTRSVLSDLARIFARAALFKTLSLIPGVGSFLGLADGGVLAKNKIVPFAYGGVVNKPTIFPMANGMGLMGEAGPEAIMPLRRGANGKLGVEASGGGTSNVTVNVDASGSSVEGNGDQAAQLGKAIGLAVQQELIKQKRPGGLLTS